MTFPFLLIYLTDSPAKLAKIKEDQRVTGQRNGLIHGKKLWKKTEKGLENTDRGAGGVSDLHSINVNAMIKLQVIGNLGKDCTTNNVNGRTVMNFSVAHTEKYRDASGQSKDRTIWVECAYWTEKTGIAPYLKKGTQVFVEGQPDIRTYTKGDGTPGTSLTLRVASVQLLGGGGRGEESTDTGSAPPPAASGGSGLSGEEDMPF
jgi:single-strand DNA-binding protein